MAVEQIHELARRIEDLLKEEERKPNMRILLTAAVLPIAIPVKKGKRCRKLDSQPEHSKRVLHSTYYYKILEVILTNNAEEPRGDQQQ